MTVCYLRNDNEIDAERCRISLREKSPITLLTLNGTGHVVCLTGVVRSIKFAAAPSEGGGEWKWMSQRLHRLSADGKRGAGRRSSVCLSR
jgi:hypothetical protein